MIYSFLNTNNNTYAFKTTISPTKKAGQTKFDPNTLITKNIKPIATPILIASPIKKVMAVASCFDNSFSTKCKTNMLVGIKYVIPPANADKAAHLPAINKAKMDTTNNAKP